MGGDVSEEKIRRLEAEVDRLRREVFRLEIRGQHLADCLSMAGIVGISLDANPATGGHIITLSLSPESAMQYERLRSIADWAMAEARARGMV